VGKFWALLFFSVPIVGTLIFLIAIAGNQPTSEQLLPKILQGTGLEKIFIWERHWLPEDVSEHGHRIDHLFYFILWLTGAVFVATEVALVWYMWRYDAATNDQPVKYVHGSHGLEVVWTILPAAVLLFIALYQINVWAEAKMPSYRPDMRPTALVTGRQFEWRIRYPGPDGDLYTPDDLYTVNDLHIPVGEDVLLVIESRDVLHSFFLPNLRVKQDLVPGMRQLLWFKANKEGNYDLVCAELCGWGHYKMKGRLTVEPRSAFEGFLENLRIEQGKATDPKPEESDDE